MLGVRTELAVAGAKDKGDLDPLAVRPLPAQEAILEALGQLGFGFKSADLEYGHIGGTGQQLPFYQEIELTPPPQYAHQINEIEVTFLAGPAGLEVVLEADKRGGFFSEGHDALTRFTVSHHGVDRSTGTPRSTPGSGRWSSTAPPTADGSHGRPHHGHGGATTGHHGDPPPQHGHRSGPGMGTAVAAGAAGSPSASSAAWSPPKSSTRSGDFFEDDEEEEGEAA